MNSPIRYSLAFVAFLLPLAVAACADDEEETTPITPAAPSASQQTEVEPSASPSAPEPTASASASASAKPKGSFDPTGIGKCCDALAHNAKSGGSQSGNYLAGAAVCNAARNNPQARAVLAQIRTALKGASMPSSCQ